MKKLLLSLTFFGTFWGSETQPFNPEKFEQGVESTNQQESSYILRMRFPSSLKVPSLCGFYKGYKLNFSSDLCVIKESRSCESFCIVIAEDVSINGNDHALKLLEQIPSKKYRMFYLEKSVKKDDSVEWTIEEEDPENIPHILPKAAVIILFHPDYIEKIDIHQKKEELIFPLEKQIATHQEEKIVRLPVIQVKKDITQKEIDIICTTSWCAAVAMRGVHRPTEVTQKNDALRFISFTSSRSVQAP